MAGTHPSRVLAWGPEVLASLCLSLLIYMTGAITAVTPRLTLRGVTRIHQGVAEASGHR